MKQTVFERLPATMNEAGEVAELLETCPLKKHWYRKVDTMCSRLDASYERLEKTPEYIDFQKTVADFEKLMDQIKAEVQKGKRRKP